MKKMNWGSWIVVSFVLFAVGTFVMVYISMSENVDLVTDDYYEKELKYQDQIEVLKSTDALEQKVNITLADSFLVLHYPVVGSHDNYSGTINFFRPSDKRGDFSRPVQNDTTHTQSFPINIFAQGLWRVKISWNVGTQQYYSELPIIIR
ncbi:MAG: FixH family protein [Bacteroidota bacterium]